MHVLALALISPALLLPSHGAGECIPAPPPRGIKSGDGPESPSRTTNRSRTGPMSMHRPTSREFSGLCPTSRPTSRRCGRHNFPFPSPTFHCYSHPQRHSQTLRTICSIARCARILSSSPVCFVAGCATPFPETKNFQNPTSTEIQNGGPTCIPCSRCGLLDNTARRVQPGRARRSPAFLRKASPATAPKHTFWRSPLFNPTG